MENLVRDETISVEVLEKMSQDELDELARKKAQEIFLNIQGAKEKIEKAKRLSSDAEGLDIGGSDITNLITLGICGKSREDKLADALRLTNKAQISQNDAIDELSEIIRESIKFTQMTSKFSLSLHRAMAFLFENGIKDANGNIIKLSDESAKAFRSLVDAAEKFAVDQARLDDKHEQMSQQINQIYTTLNSKAQIDDAQEAAITSNAKNIEKIILNLDDKNNLDIKQDELIAKNAALIAQNSEILRKLQTKSSTKIYMICTLSLIISLISLALYFIKI
jgi:hypothetical protein|nr:hypothetical protein [uncultured Campylobacter sp.]